MRRFAGRHPWAAAIAIAAGLIAGTVLLRLLAFQVGACAPRITFAWLAVILQTAVALAIVRGLRWWRAVGFTRPGEWRDRWLLAILWIPIGLALLSFFRGVHTGPAEILMIAALSLLIGLNEETYFRGLVLRFLLRRGAMVAMVGSAVLFGIAHVGNLLSPGASGMAVGYQMASAALIGMFFAGLRLRMNTIWPLIAAHALIDFSVLATTYPNLTLREPPIPALIVGLGISLIFAIVGLIIGAGAGKRLGVAEERSPTAIPARQAAQ